jgi:hypothetical protein
MKPVSEFVEKWWQSVTGKAENGDLQTRLFVSRLVTGVAFTFLAFAAGWLGGRWAVQGVLRSQESPPTLSEQQTTVPQSLGGVGQESAPAALHSSATLPGTANSPASQSAAPTVYPLPAPSPAESNGEGRAYLGIRGKEFRKGTVQGVKVTEVFPGSPAAEAGLRSERDPEPSFSQQSGGSGGHVIIGANGRAIRSEKDLGRILTASTPGSVVEFLVTSVDGNFYGVIPVRLGTSQAMASEQR